MLKSARDHYRLQQRINALTLSRVRRAGTSLQVAAAIAFFQSEAVLAATTAVVAELSEQGLSVDAAGRLNPAALLTDRAAIVRFLDKVESRDGLDRLALSLVNDAGRTASSVEVVQRRSATRYVRSVQGTACGRCAVLAGRVYRYSTGFLRHPRCTCTMVPTSESDAEDHVLDVKQAVRDGRVHGLSKADREAVELGADLGQVVNVRRKQAGLTVGSSVMDRAGTPTPAGILRSAGSREQAINLLQRHGYLL